MSSNIPAWAVNRCSQMVAPKSVAKLAKTARLYPEWKKTHSPNLKPWLHPEQHTLRPINWADVSESPDFVVSEIVEEAAVARNGVVDDTGEASAAAGEAASGPNATEMSNVAESNGSNLSSADPLVNCGITVNGIPTGTEG
ncbi:unnamed protein product [Schistocephalus solidus]|uniref:Holocytochrome c-type synthase n=1 Tax=Schistocephalus solidus TaxID=70667 RepID=A0A183SM21_SCHSO|nr:unnamed protein product [Schistocephalus solidus]